MPVPLGDDDPDVDDPEGEVDDGLPLGGIVLDEPEPGPEGLVADEPVDGEADGEVPPGRSPTRSDCDSVHPAATVAIMASAQRPDSSFFIRILPRCECAPP